jgi:hypothetical protein
MSKKQDMRMEKHGKAFELKFRPAPPILFAWTTDEVGRTRLHRELPAQHSESFRHI